MSSGPIRRGQLIAPFGVGAMTVNRDGVSLIAAGLDHWYKIEGEGGVIDADEFIIREWRLESLLKVDHLRMPPDFRQKRPGQNIPNVGLTVPFLRFPQWHFCPSCNRLNKRPLVERGRKGGKILCEECEARRKRRYLYQVPFIAICDEGHIQDFPWREWVHRSVQPECQKSLRLIATGGASLAGQLVKCDCGAERSLAQIMGASPSEDTTELSENLDKSTPYMCCGSTPWLGTEEPGTCGRPLRGSLRSASNVYFALMRSAIYMPRGNEIAPPDLVYLLETPPICTMLGILMGVYKKAERIEAETLRKQYRVLLEPYSDAQIKSAILLVHGEAGREEIGTGGHLVEGDDKETEFRRMEFNILRTVRNEDQLLIKEADLDKFEPDLAKFFSKIMLVQKLRETRALAGFRRVFPENERTIEESKSILWRKRPSQAEEWLPAYIVYGEGIFIELNERCLETWQRDERIINRVRPLANRYNKVQKERRLRQRPVGPRLVLLHTLAHLLINRLTFDCGYSSAALRERLYVSEDPGSPMAGLLIYTAAGDAEGTMGGLVRMGNPGSFEPVLWRALEAASWCSADPVCMEVATRGGQGPDSCNLAACHACALVPETACEEFNRFLDRGLLVGEPTDRSFGYFNMASR